MITAQTQNGGKQTYPVSGRYKDVSDSCDFGDPIPLYTTPPKQENELDAIDRAYFAGKQAGIAECEAVKREWVGLTDEEIDAIGYKYGAGGLELMNELTSKLKEKNT
jgi:hypothetical protein